MNINKYKKYIVCSFISLAIGSLATAGLVCIQYGDNIRFGKKLDIIRECRDIISKNGNPDFNDEEAYYGAINGYLNSGGDKYTYYYKHDNADPVAEMISYVNNSGTAKASGFQIAANDDGNILITDITKGMAADNQGLKVNDIIIDINGVSVSEKKIENIANKLMGKQDTTVDLKVIRENEEISLTFKRDNEYQRTANWKKINDLGYISISTYEYFTAGNMSNAMNDLSDCKAYIIDLRENRGGLTDVSVQISDHFIGDAKVVMHAYNGESEVYETKKSEKDVKVPIVILTNNNTASAAEIMTALIKQYGTDVTVVGEKTFGKGIYQKEESLSDGGKLHYTAGYYTVGDMECYQGIGIEPDVEVKMDSTLIGTDDDIQLKKAIEILEKQVTDF